MKKDKTIDVMKQKREPSKIASEKRKEFVKIKKIIKASLKEGSKTIPQLAEETKLEKSVLMYTIMSLRKYGEIIETGIDDMDEYYIYDLKK